MGPDLYFVRIIVTFEGRTEGLKQDVELDGAPTDGEEQDNDRHHAGYFSAHNLRALRQKLYLVAVISRLHRGPSHLIDHGGVTDANSEQRKQIHHQEVVKDESLFMGNRWERFTAIHLRPKPIAFSELVIDGDRDGHNKGTYPDS